MLATVFGVDGDDVYERSEEGYVVKGNKDRYGLREITETGNTEVILECLAKDEMSKVDDGSLGGEGV